MTICERRQDVAGRARRRHVCVDFATMRQRTLLRASKGRAFAVLRRPRDVLADNRARCAAAAAAAAAATEVVEPPVILRHARCAQDGHGWACLRRGQVQTKGGAVYQSYKCVVCGAFQRRFL